MKSRYAVLLVLASFTAGCHRPEAALSANGVKISVGQTVQAVRHAFACMSAERLKQAVALRAAGDKAQLYSLFKTQPCEFF